jgi:NAD(P)-dependent dehydrogenase (short-subunit alcohol dehydrogenase family)
MSSPREEKRGITNNPRNWRNYLHQSSLQGKCGLLTGGSSGFGLEIVKGLAAQGANVAVFSADEPPVEEREYLTRDGAVHFYAMDITTPEASDRMVELTQQRYGSVDFAVANAGFAIRFEQPLLSISTANLADGLRRQFEIFPVAFATLALAAARAMAPKYSALKAEDSGHRFDSGAIVVNLSESALTPLRDDLLAYAAAKKATHWIMRSLAATLGHLNIRVNGIAPGFANTKAPRLFYDRHPEIRQDVERQAHLKPAFMASAAVVPAVLYLLTDNYCTGEVIALDGGYNIHQSCFFQEEES